MVHVTSVAPPQVYVNSEGHFKSKRKQDIQRHRIWRLSPERAVEIMSFHSGIHGNLELFQDYAVAGSLSIEFSQAGYLSEGNIVAYGEDAVAAAVEIIHSIDLLLYGANLRCGTAQVEFRFSFRQDIFFGEE